MQFLVSLLTLALLPLPIAAYDGYAPYSDPLFGLPVNERLEKRQSCKSGYNLCSNVGANNACCPSDTNCALDQAGHVACCPFNAVCTGTIDGTVRGSITGTSTSGATGTSNFVLGGTTTSSTASFQSAAIPTTGIQGGGSTVPNTFYPFIYIPTSYANGQLCSQYWSSCQTASTSCFSSLAGVNGVTVSGFGGGITVQGSTGTILSSASSICSSLSASACYNLQETQCSNFGGAQGPSATGSTTGFVQPANNAHRQAACPGVLYAAAGAGAAVGAMGALI